MICLGSIIGTVYICKVEGVTQTQIVDAFLRSIYNDAIGVSNEEASNIVNGKRNPSKYVREKISKISTGDYDRIVEYFNNNIVNLIKENERVLARNTIILMIKEDTGIQDDTIVEVISGIKKSDISDTEGDFGTFLAGVFLYIMKNTDNSLKNTGGRIKGEVEKYFEKAKKLKSKNQKKGKKRRETKENDQIEAVLSIEPVYMNYEEEQIEQQAVTFCMKYDQNKDFIALCQMTSITNPTRKHCREMFNEYNRCTRSVRKKILEISGIKIISISDNEWWWDYLEKFKNDYTRYKLGASNHVYLFGQYFPRLLDYRDGRIDRYLEHVFLPKVEQPMLINYKFDVPGVIDEYIKYRNEKKYKNILEPPMEFFFRELDLGGCEEFQLVVVLALFIIGTCRAIPIEKQEESGQVIYSGACWYNLENAEDLFYQTLIFLYETYAEGTG